MYVIFISNKLSDECQKICQNGQILGDRIIVPIRCHLGNLKKSYLGTLRQPIRLQTSEHPSLNVWVSNIWLT